jgi:HPt (histidine-containing phosphotransfer) domain-containing protein
MAAPTDAELEALEKELEQFKSDAARQLDELAALTQAADQCIADSKRETHEARPCAACAAALHAAWGALPGGVLRAVHNMRGAAAAVCSAATLRRQVNAA